MTLPQIAIKNLYPLITTVAAHMILYICDVMIQKLMIACCFFLVSKIWPGFRCTDALRQIFNVSCSHFSKNSAGHKNLKFEILYDRVDYKLKNRIKPIQKEFINTKKPAKPPQCKYVELNGLRVLLILSLFERVCEDELVSMCAQDIES